MGRLMGHINTFSFPPPHTNPLENKNRYDNNDQLPSITNDELGSVAPLLLERNKKCFFNKI